jgi:hypothetical protein
LDEDLDDEDTLEGETNGGDLVTDDRRLEDLEIDEVLSAVGVLDARREDIGVVELLVVVELLLEDAFVEEVWIRLDDDFGVEKALLELVFFDEIFAEDLTVVEDVLLSIDLLVGRLATLDGVALLERLLDVDDFEADFAVVALDVLGLLKIHLQAFCTAGTFKFSIGESCRSLCQ